MSSVLLSYQEPIANTAKVDVPASLGFQSETRSKPHGTPPAPDPRMPPIGTVQPRPTPARRRRRSPRTAPPSPSTLEPPTSQRRRNERSNQPRTPYKPDGLAERARGPRRGDGVTRHAPCHGMRFSQRPWHGSCTSRPTRRPAVWYGPLALSTTRPSGFHGVVCGLVLLRVRMRHPPLDPPLVVLPSVPADQVAQVVLVLLAYLGLQTVALPDALPGPSALVSSLG